MSRRSARLGLFLVLLASIAVHAPSLANGFAGDDRRLVRDPLDDGRPNVMVADLGASVSRPYWSGDDDRLDPLWRPVTSASFAAVHRLAGRPQGDLPRATVPQHALNVALHALGVWLIYRLARRLHAARRTALAAAAVFGLHALHTEVVAQVVGRGELLTFAAGAGAAVVLSARGLGHRLLAAALFALAFGSKENGLVWLVLAPLVAAHRIQPRPARPRWWGALWRGLLVGTYLAFAWLILRADVLGGLERPPVAHGVNPLAWLDLGERIPAALTVWAFGLGQTLLPGLGPFALRPDYSVPVFDVDVGWFDGRFLLALLALASVVTGTWLGRRRPLVAIGGIAILASTLPIANLAFPIGTIHAERLWFTATAGIALWAGELSRRLPPRALLAALLAWGAGNAAVITGHTPTFADDAALVAAAADDPGGGAISGRAHYVHARQLARADDLTGAGRHLALAVALDPDLGAAWNDLGLHWLAQGEREKARDAFVVGTAARDQDDDTRYVLHKNIASLAVLDGDLDAARTALTRCLTIDGVRLTAEFGALTDEYARSVSDAWLAETLARLQSATGEPLATAGLFAQQGRLAYRRGRFAEAIGLCRAALRLFDLDASKRANDDRVDWLCNECRIWLAASLIERGSHAEARPVLDAIATAPDADADQRDRAERLRALMPR